MAEVLNVKQRETRGKRNAKRMRNAGAIPAILYGHGEASQSLEVVGDEMASVVRHGGRVVELKQHRSPLGIDVAYTANGERTELAPGWDAVRTTIGDPSPGITPGVYRYLLVFATQDPRSVPREQLHCCLISSRPFVVRDGEGLTPCSD